MIKKIITNADKLGYRSDEIDIRKENQEMRDIIICLKDVIREKKLVSLSAPQLGFYKRIIVINFNGELRSFVNPIITEAKGFELSRETCTSIPKKSYIRPRNNEITITYQTPLGKIESRKMVGKAAMVFQHAIDHLDGLLISDIGLEVTKDFDNATEDERAEFIKMYLDSLDVKQKEVEEEINKDPELKKTSDAIDFLKKVQSGEVKLSNEVVAVAKPKQKKTRKTKKDKE